MNRAAVGFIGIGKMGLPMVGRLLSAGHAVTAFNRTPGKLDAVREAGASVAACPADVAAATELIVLCLRDSAAVEDVVFGPNGIAAARRCEGRLLVDCSSISPACTRALAARLEDVAGMHWLDAPVSGGVIGAQRGSLVFMCGGAAEDYERAQRVFASLGQHSTHMGPVGSGQVTKLCNQMIVSCNLAVIAEAINLAQRTGVDAQRLPEALHGGFADSLPLQIYGPRMAQADERPAMGEIRTMHKDMLNALQHAQAQGVPTPMTESAAALYAQVANSGYASADLEALIRLFDR
ncbi:MAG: NAD(P)-dependent oxidoreductase [Gammaproteobacteria bacterium]|nr:NAD(P)-dependent oxidoreductase [Gammaproteobacteria bacterium]